MPELDAKMRTAASKSRRTTNGINHHFFSRAQNLKNSRKTVHINALISLWFAMFAAQGQPKKEAEVFTSASLIHISIAVVRLTAT